MKNKDDFRCVLIIIRTDAQVERLKIGKVSYSSYSSYDFISFFVEHILCQGFAIFRASDRVLIRYSKDFFTAYNNLEEKLRIAGYPRVE